MACPLSRRHARSFWMPRSAMQVAAKRRKLQKGQLFHNGRNGRATKATTAPRTARSRRRRRRTSVRRYPKSLAAQLFSHPETPPTRLVASSARRPRERGGSGPHRQPRRRLVGAGHDAPRASNPTAAIQPDTRFSIARAQRWTARLPSWSRCVPWTCGVWWSGKKD